MKSPGHDLTSKLLKPFEFLVLIGAKSSRCLLQSQQRRHMTGSILLLRVLSATGAVPPNQVLVPGDQVCCTGGRCVLSVSEELE